MASSIVQPYQGDLVVDLQPLKGVLLDAVHGATRGLRREKPGIEKALSEIKQNIPAHAEILGVTPNICEHAAALTERIALIRKMRVQIDKLAEVLAETEAFTEDELEGDIGLIVNAVRRASIRKDPTIVALFEETIRYHGQHALRAHKSRLKNEQPTASDAPASPA